MIIFKGKYKCLFFTSLFLYFFEIKKYNQLFHLSKCKDRYILKQKISTYKNIYGVKTEHLTIFYIEITENNIIDC